MSTYSLSSSKSFLVLEPLKLNRISIFGSVLEASKYLENISKLRDVYHDS